MPHAAIYQILKPKPYKKLLSDVKIKVTKNVCLDLCKYLKN